MKIVCLVDLVASILLAATTAAVPALAPENGQSRLTSAATGVSTNAYPLKIVTCREDVDVDALLAEFQIKLQSPKHKMRALKMFAALLDDPLIQRLKADPRVEAVEADGPVSLCGQVNGFGIRRMGIPEFPPAHINHTNELLNVNVAILDTGIDAHEDLPNVVRWVSVFDEDGNDVVNHGTAVAGVLGALDNGIGIVGVAPGVRIWNIKVSGPPPNDSWYNVLQGLDYVLLYVDKISVVNLSLGNPWGSYAPALAVRTSVRELVLRGVVVVAAVGNNGGDLAGPDGVYDLNHNLGTDDIIPAAVPEAMAVSGMDATIYTQGSQPADVIWAGSNFSQIERTNRPGSALSGWTNYVLSPGGAIDVAAPGINILTTVTNNGYDYLSGTSFAAPHVAGLVALYIAANGRATNEAGVYRIRQAIVDNAQPQPQWHTNNTHDPDSHPEPLAIASDEWVPKPVITNTAGTPGNFHFGFLTVPGYDYTVQSTSDLTPPISWTNYTTISGSYQTAPGLLTDSTPADQRFYRVTHQPSPANFATSDFPLVITQPQPPSAYLHWPANLSVFAIGAEPLSYQWRKAGTDLSNGANLSGVTSATLSMDGLKLSDQGAYDVVITNDYGSVTSQLVTIIVQTNNLQVDRLAYYPFDGNANDASGNGRHAIVQGATLTSNRLGQADSAYLVTGTQYLRVEGLDPDNYHQGFSFGGWVKMSVSGGLLFYWPVDDVWANRQAPNVGSTFIALDIGFNALRFQFSSATYPGTPGINGVSGLSLAQDRWQHIFVTHGMTKDHLYIGGQLVNQWPSYPLEGNRSTLSIGPGSWLAAVDDLSVYGRELTAGEVDQLFNTPP